MMRQPPPTYSSPEAAGMVGFPPAHCRVVACAVEGNDGIVIADTSQAGAPYLYATRVERTPDGWVEGGSSNALGWMSLDHDLGNVALWDVAPNGADRVRVEFQGALREEPVVNGVYLLVWWRVPCPPAGAWRDRSVFARGGGATRDLNSPAKSVRRHSRVDKVSGIEVFVPEGI